ncbi:MAG: hypothetical protein ABIR62_04950 [Dokdonella sp.]|uniref:hypothetical protein n=1 Tax=Dokdonella sp. TaxID=2291710 RepID=UPI00326627B5
MIMSIGSVASVLALAILTASVAPAQAATPEPIDCHRMRLPSMRDVGERLDIHNFSETYAARTRLVLEVQRQCMHGARFVQWMSHRDPAPPQARTFAGK